MTPTSSTAPHAKPHTFHGDLTKLPAALLPLTKLKRWVVWRWELRVSKTGREKWTKPPYQPSAPERPAKSNDPSTWGSYADAVLAVIAGKADGIGLMLKDSEAAAADLDHVRNAESGELLGWAERLCVEADALGLYREVTVSGCGLRFIGLSRGNELHRKFTVNRKSGAGIELYRNCARYITISGLQEGSCQELGPINDYLDTLLARFDGQATTAPDNPFDFNDAGPQAGSYQDIIENGAPEGSRSEEFQRVVWHLASQGWSAEEIAEEIVRHPGGIGAKYAGRLAIEVKRSYRKWQGHTGTAGAPSQQGGGASPQQQAPSWLRYCQVDAKGRPLSNLANAMLALRNDPAVKGIFAYDEMHRGEVLIREIGGQVDLAAPRPVHDVDVIALQEWFQLNGLPLIGTEIVHKAADLRARERPFHPVRGYLNNLRWDGMPRVEFWLCTYLGVTLADYTNSSSRALAGSSAGIGSPTNSPTSPGPGRT